MHARDVKAMGAIERALLAQAGSSGLHPAKLLVCLLREIGRRDVALNV